MMQTLTVNIVGQADISRSRQYTRQTCINLYPEINQNAKSPAAMMCWPGLKSFGNTSTTEVDRGMYVFEGEVYKVSGNTLYKIDVGGNYTTIGTIDGSGYTTFTDDGFQMTFVTGGLVYNWDGTTLTQLTDVDLETPNAVAFLNNQWIYDGNGGTFVVSNVGTPGTLEGLNYAAAEAIGDDLIRPYAFNQVLYLFGERSIESWYNSGVGTPPFDRIEGGLIQKGLAGVHCVCNTDQFVYFMADDRTVYQLANYNVRSVTTASMAHEFEIMTTVSDAVFYTIKLEGQDFIVMYFPTEGKTFCYSETSNFWFQLSSGVSGGQHLATSYVYCYGKHLVGYQGNVYEWSLSTFDDLGAAQVKERILAPIDGSLAGAPGKRLMMNRFELIMQTGVGTATGQGSNPVVMFSLSPDGGETWGAEYQVSIGQGGRYQTRVEWYHIESFYSGVIKIRFTDPVFVGMFSATIDLDLAGY
jgi:hypothetical protein